MSTELIGLTRTESMLKKAAGNKDIHQTTPPMSNKTVRLALWLLVSWLTWTPLSSAESTTSASNSANPPNQIIRISTGEYPPFSSESQPDNNVVNQVVKESFALKGVSVEFDFYPWARAYQLAQNGKYDGTSYWFKNTERAQHFLYSEVVVTSHTYMFHLKEKPLKWNRLQDLAGLNIGVTRGYTYSDNFFELGEKGVYTLHLTNSDEQNFQMLLRGRTDGFPMELYPAYYLLKTFSPEDMSKITYHPRALIKTTGHLLLTKQSERNKKLMLLFNQGLRELKKSGRFDEIYSSITRPNK